MAARIGLQGFSYAVDAIPDKIWHKIPGFKPVEEERRDKERKSSRSSERRQSKSSSQERSRSHRGSSASSASRSKANPAVFGLPAAAVIPEAAPQPQYLPQNPQYLPQYPAVQPQQPIYPAQPAVYQPTYPQPSQQPSQSRGLTTNSSQDDYVDPFDRPYQPHPTDPPQPGPYVPASGATALDPYHPQPQQAVVGMAEPYFPPPPTQEHDAYDQRGGSRGPYNPSSYAPVSQYYEPNGQYNPGNPRNHYDPYQRPASTGPMSGQGYYQDDNSSYDDRPRRSHRKHGSSSESRDGKMKSGLRRNFEPSKEGIADSALGAIAGGLIGHEIGHGALSTVAGALIGGIGGNAWAAREHRHRDARNAAAMAGRGGSGSRDLDMREKRRSRSEGRSVVDDRDRGRYGGGYGGGGGGGYSSEEEEDYGRRDGGRGGSRRRSSHRDPYDDRDDAYDSRRRSQAY